MREHDTTGHCFLDRATKAIAIDSRTLRYGSAP
ncbi:hypothetical protein A8924_2909 [Saccharopolyspora erythraea NRRL 2338]|nr:hypothetical protein N599_04140 [Saccharopolyspora erythraea D]PFG95571.1 hypothetical protein A8924_2909 [Saccharopolyspora erythraea NRRL 2338]